MNNGITNYLNGERTPNPLGIPQLRQGLLEFFDYVEESNKKNLKTNMFVPLILVKIQLCICRLMNYKVLGNKQKNSLNLKPFFLENDYDLPKEMPDYIPALLELCAVIDDEKAKEIYDYCKPKLEYIRERFIEAKLPYAFLFDIILSVANGLEDGAR